MFVDLSVRVDPSNPHALREHLATALVPLTGILARQQKLVHKGRVLAGGLADAGVRDGATLLLLGGAGTAGKAARGGKGKGKGKASPAGVKGTKTGGGAVSRAKKAAKQQVRVVPTSRQSSRRTLSETSSRAPSRAAPRVQTRVSDRSRPSPSRLPSGVGRRAVSRRRRVEW